MRKKGVSPLIATVLIIGFTIVLAAVVMQWGGSFVRELTEKQAESTQVATDCMQLRFEVNSATYVSNTVTFKVTNSVDKSIKSFVALVDKGTAGSESLSPEVDDCEVSSFSTTECTIVTDKTIVTGSDKLKLVPMIELEDGSAKGCTIDSAVSRVIEAGA